MANYSFTDLRDKVLVWLAGRRLGVTGDNYGSNTAVLALDGATIGATRSGPNSIKAASLGHNGAGAVTVAGVLIGDAVEFVYNVTTPGDVTSSFESTVSVNGQVQQTSASNLSAAN